MNVIAAAKAYNQRALRHKWHQACDPTLAFSDDYYARLLATWRFKAGGHSMPARSQMTARDLKDYLRHVILVQREERNPSRYRWRLIGTSVTEIVGHHTGKLFEDSIPTELVPRWTEACDMILESEQPWRFLGRVHIGGRDFLKAEQLYLPLSDDDGMPSFVMGLCRYIPRHQDNEEMSEDEFFSLPNALL